MANNFTYKMNIDGDIGNLLGKLKTLKDQLASITNDGKEPKITKMLDQLGARIDAIKSKASAPIKSEAVFGSIEKDIQSVYRVLENLGTELDSIAKKTNSSKIEFLPESQRKILLGIVSAMEEYDNAIDASTRKSKELLKAEGDLAKAENKLIADKQKLANLEKTADSAKQARDTAKAALDEAKGRQEAAEAAQKQLERIQKLADAAKKAEKKGGEKVDLRSAKFDDGNGGQMTLQQARSNAAKTAANVSDPEEITRLNDAYKEANATATQLTTRVGTLKASIEQQNSAIALARDKVEDLTSSFDASKLKASEDAFTTLRQKVKDLGVSMEGIGTENISENIDLLRQRMEEFVAAGVAPVDDQMRTASATMGEMSAATDQAAESTRRSTEEFREQNEAAGEVSGLMQRIKQFTGLTGAALIARRALRDAIETTKELDKQMTEMAVVTNLEVGDFWNQLPEHTERANALGVAINEIYKAETLYYQQGLKTAQVTQLSTSTLKMARIAGLNAEDATNKMTAALRGFNMEINETNANRIADVYSKLAAITASNVQEISSAMTKTASIASSAGMKFETTAAFLSQIIETTRESAETAGTALKTVIARFQELKKSPDEIGEVDGEVIDANKIETALRTVGVALRDTSGQFRNLDDVFMELAQKWDTLDMNTQRYIATIAAGSRQQSRFVAMMSDYSRTQELVNAANNAAGASNEQFEKTLESLETKLNKLKNAWDTFTQGLANNQFIKMAVDILTGLLTAINKVTEGFGPWSGSALKIGLVTAALIAGDKALRIFTQSLKDGSSVLGAFGNTFKTAGSSVKNLILRLTAQSKAMKAHNTITKEGIAAIQARKKAEQALSNANATVATHENRINALRAQGNIVTNEQVEEETKLKIAKAQQAAASEGVVKAQEEEILALGLSATQQKVYNTMVSAGVHEETAAILAKNGLTTASWANMQAAYGEAAGAHASELAQKLQNAGLIKGTFIKWNDQIATIAQAAAHGTYTGSLIIATIAQLAFNIAVKLGCSPVLVLTTAIILLTGAIIGIVFAFKAIANETPEAKFEKANKALREATELADAAKESYDNLKDSFSSINDKYGALDELTVGTREWRDALQEVNAEVMDLIDEYPELASAVKVDENGVMRINEDAQEAVLAAKQAEVAAANNAKLTAQIAKNNAKANLDYSKMSNKAIAGDQNAEAWKGAGQGALAGGMAGVAGALAGAIVGAINGEAISRTLNKEVTDKFAMALASGKAGVDRDDWKDYIQKTLGLSPEEAEQWINELDSGAIDELREYGGTLNANIAAEEAAMKSMIANAQALIDTNKYTQEQMQQMLNIGTQMAKEAEMSAKAKVSNMSDAEYERRVKEKYGEEAGIDKHGNVKAGDVEFNKSDMENLFAAEEATENLAKKMELLPKALDSVNSSLQKTGKSSKEAAKISDAADKLFKDDQGGVLTKEALDSLSGNSLKEIYESNEYLQELYGSFDKFNNEMKSRIKNATNDFEKVRTQLNEIGLNNFKLDDTLSPAAYKGLAEQITNVLSVSGVDGARQFGELVNQTLSDLSEEEKEKVAGIINAMDLSDASSIENFREQLEGMGVSMPLDKIKHFTSEAVRLGDAVHKISLEELNKDLATLTNTVKELREGTREQARSLSEEEYNALVKYNPDLKGDFIQDLKGNFIYLGASLDDLANAATNAGQVLANERISTLEGQVAAGKIVEEMTKSGDYERLSGATKWSESDKRKFLTEFLEKTEGMDISGLSTISKNTHVNELNITQLNEALDELNTTMNAKSANEAEIKSIGRQVKVTQALQNDIVSNSVNGFSAMQSAVGAKKGSSEQDRFRESRATLSAQFSDYGMSEVEIATFARLNKELETMEGNLQTDSQAYKDTLEQYNNFTSAMSTKAGFKQMYSKLTDNINGLKEMREELDQMTNATARAQKVDEIVGKLGIDATEENTAELVSYIDGMLAGNEESFDKFLNYSANSYGLLGDVISEVNGQTTKDLKEQYGVRYEEYEAWMQKMVDLGYARWEDMADGSKKFITGVKESIEIADELVEKAERWINPYDWLWHRTQLTNSLLRERNHLEKEYTWMLELNQGTTADITQNYIDQLELIQKEQENYKTIFDNAQIDLKQAEETWNKELSKYEGSEVAEQLKNMWGFKDGMIAVDARFIDTAYGENGENSELGQAAESFVSITEEKAATLKESLENLEDTFETFQALYKKAQDGYSSLIERVRNALAQFRQEAIDKMTSINETVQETSQSLIDKIQEQINDQREVRNDEKTLQDIENKQAQLSYLQASGGSQLDILKLQEDITNAQESYQDTLIDRMISQMSDQADKAAEQRQHQIDIAQAQYDYWEKNEANLEAEAMVRDALANGGAGINGLHDMLFRADGMSHAHSVALDEWTQGWKKDLSGAVTFLNSTFQTDYNTVKGYWEKAQDAANKTYEKLSASNDEGLFTPKRFAELTGASTNSKVNAEVENIVTKLDPTLKNMLALMSEEKAKDLGKVLGLTDVIADVARDYGKQGDVGLYGESEYVRYNPQNASSGAINPRYYLKTLMERAQAQGKDLGDLPGLSALKGQSSNYVDTLSDNTVKSMVNSVQSAWDQRDDNVKKFDQIATNVGEYGGDISVAYTKGYKEDNPIIYGTAAEMSHTWTDEGKVGGGKSAEYDMNMSKTEREEELFSQENKQAFIQDVQNFVNKIKDARRNEGIKKDTFIQAINGLGLKEKYKIPGMKTAYEIWNSLASEDQKTDLTKDILEYTPKEFGQKIKNNNWISFDLARRKFIIDKGLRQFKDNYGHTFSNYDEKYGISDAINELNFSKITTLVEAKEALSSSEASKFLAVANFKNSEEAELISNSLSDKTRLLGPDGQLSAWGIGDTIPTIGGAQIVKSDKPSNNGYYFTANGGSGKVEEIRWNSDRGGFDYLIYLTASKTANGKLQTDQDKLGVWVNGGSAYWLYQNYYKKGLSEPIISQTDPSISGIMEDLIGKGPYDEQKIKEAFSKDILFHYATGGLADFTGPAWLDGTKSAPELVLNAQDTQNFIVLKDILADILRGTSNQNNKVSGDNYYDIDVNVEELKDNYDVDQLVDHVKDIIIDDAMYRNVNAVQQIR